MTTNRLSELAISRALGTQRWTALLVAVVGISMITCTPKKKQEKKPTLQAESGKPRTPPRARPAPKLTPLRLPDSISATQPSNAPEVRVHQNGIALGADYLLPVKDGRVAASAKRGGKDGFLIKALYTALSEKAAAAKATEADTGVRFQGHLRLSVDTRTSYRLLAEVLYTAAKARYTRYQLAVKPQQGKPGVLVFQTPQVGRASVGRASITRGARSLNLMVIITDKGYYIKSRNGSECPPGSGEDARLCFVKDHGKYTARVRSQLQHHAWYLHADKYKASKHYHSVENRHAITVIAEPTVSVGDLARTLDALREIPATSKKPKVKHKVPYAACKLVYDKKLNTFGFPHKGEESTEELYCVYSRPVLAIGM